MSEAFPVTNRTRLRRMPERGEYSRAEVYSILDEALICHVGFQSDDGPVVIPTIHARHEDTLYLHGSNASRMLRTVGDGRPVCVTATLVDGLVLARSVFHHSMNYRSVIVFGTASVITDHDVKLAAMEALVNRLVPGRWADARHPTEKEFAATLMLSIDIDEASAKIRTGPPGDDEEDYDLDVWAGIVSLTRTFGPPLTDPAMTRDVGVPGYVTRYKR